MTTKKLRDFAVFKVCNAYRHQASRVSVFVPVFGRDTQRQLEDIPAAFGTLRTQWRARCDALYSTRTCPGLTCGTQVLFLKNCPPFGVYTTDQTRTCGRALFCPFCFARQRVLDPFRRMETVLYGTSGPYMQGQQMWEEEQGLPVTRNKKQLELLRKDLKLVWFRRKQAFVKPGLPFNVGTVATHVRFVLKNWVSSSRKVEFDGFKAEYGYVGFDVSVDHECTHVCLTRYGVLMVKKDSPESLVKEYRNTRPEGERIRRHFVRCALAEASKQGLCEAFSLAVRYPLWMLRGDPVICSEVILALRNFRATSAYKLPHGTIPKPR